MENQKIPDTPLYQNEDKKAIQDSGLCTESAQLLRMFLHDIKNPLASLVGYLGLVSMMSKSMEENSKRYITNAVWSGNDMSLLCKNIEESLAIESGQLKPKFERFEPAKMLQKEVERLQPVGEFFQKKFVLHIQPDLPPAEGDKTLLARLFQTMLSHCLMHHTAPCGIEVLLEQKENTLCFQALDEGTPVAEKNRAIYFDPLFPIHCAKGERRPKGWDLYFCKLVTELHGGQISVQSEGNKMKFMVLLPYSSSGDGAGR